MSDTTDRRTDKHLILDQAKLSKAQKILGVKTETETVERALNFVIGEDERSQMARTAHDRFMRVALREGLLINDAFGRLGERSGKGVN